jgi:ABC-2 type transport system permease protein
MLPNRILAQCQKELVQFQRDRLTLALAILLPLATLFIFGFAIRLEATDIPLLVQDYDRTPLSQRYVDQLLATHKFQTVAWPLEHPSEAAIATERAKAVVIIPPDLTRRLADQKSSPIQILIDGSDTNNARVIQNLIRATTQAFLRREGLLPEQGPITPRTRLWFNPGRKEALFIVPGTYAVVLWIFPSLLSAIAMVRETEKGTILQVYASSLTATDLLLGKAIAYLMVSLSMAAVVMGIGAIVFDIWLVGDPTPLIVGTLLYLGASVMFGLFLGARSRSQNAAVQGVSLFGFVTALLLSGFIYPLTNIPFPLSLIANVIPARYFMEVTRDAFVRGVGWSNVWFAVLMITLLGCGLFTAARHALGPMQLRD